MARPQFYFRSLLTILSFLLAIHLTDSRYMMNKKTENDLSERQPEDSTDDDDVNLETYLEEYYNDLWDYLEPGQSKKKKKEENEGEGEGEKGKQSFPNYDYMSDMAAPEPEVDGKKFRALEKENLTWSYGGESGFNNSYGDGGIPDAVMANRERSKQLRLKSIIDQVLSFRGGSSRLNESIPDGKHYNALREIYEKNIKKIDNDEWTSSYTEKVQSFYPSCDTPRNTDEDVWYNKSSMNLLFDLDYPSPQEDSTIMIVSAKLRLYKLPQESYSAPNAETSTPKIKWDKTQTSYGVLPIDDDRQIRVSVYWYTRSLRRNRIKKKLLDSQMLSLHSPKWVEFNVRPAVRTWKESGKNFGLVVNVEDEDGSLLFADQFIQSMNCSQWTANLRPVPSIIMDRFNQYFVDVEGRNETEEETRSDEDKHKIFPFQPLPYPIIDLRTREVPDSDVKSIALMNSAKKALESNLMNFSRSGFRVANESIASFLKKNNLEPRDISRLSSGGEKSSRKSGEPRVSYFQNVPIGSPSRDPEEDPRSKAELPETEASGGKEERETSNVRHVRKQWNVFQKSTNSNSRLRNDFNATDHH